MKRKLIKFTILAAVLIISGCVPISTTKVNHPVAEITVVETDASIASQGTVFSDFAETATVPFPLAVPTSRGDQLAATDPASVNLSAGVPTLVEFFRFT